MTDSRKWPLLTMRQMTSTTFDHDAMRALIAINVRHPGSCDEYWLADSDDYPPEQKALERRASGTLGVLADELRAAGIIPGFQQGITLGHDFSFRPDEVRRLPADAYQVDVDGALTAFLCPTSPDVLAFEEKFAETCVRLGKLESFWLDDDLRMGYYKKRAASCWCPRCLALLNEKAGTSFTREAFIARLSSDAPDDPLRAVWAAFKAESLARFAAAARRGAKRANPSVRMGFQATSSATIGSGEDFLPILEALSDGFRDTVGIRPGDGFYQETNPRCDMPVKLLAAAREAERCRAYPGWNGSIAYEQENYPHFAMEKSAEAIVKEGALSLAAGCDAIAQYWYSSAHPEPFDHYDDVARLTAAWRPYLERLAALAPQTHLGGVALRPDPHLMTGPGNTVPAILSNAHPRRDASETALALMGVPVTVAEAGAKSFFEPADVPHGQYASADRDALLDKLDALPGGPVCVRTDKVHPLIAYPRVTPDGRTRAVTFLNTSIGRATGIPVRLRRPAGGKVLLARPCEPDVELAATPGVGDEIRLVLPDIPAWEIATLLLS